MTRAATHSVNITKILHLALFTFSLFHELKSTVSDDKKLHLSTNNHHYAHVRDDDKPRPFRNPSATAYFEFEILAWLSKMTINYYF